MLQSARLDTLWDLLFPAYCQGCGTEGSYLCLSCQTKLIPPTDRCWVCAKPSWSGRIHPECAHSRTYLDGLLVAADYHAPSIKNLIWHLKYNSAHTIVPTLSLILTDFFLSRDLTDYFASAAVVAVPLHRKRLRQRGFNHAELLAQNFAKNLGYPFLPILQKIKNTQTQVDLERSQRLTNLAGSFAAAPTPALGERKIILVDDVATTGATLNECAKLLKAQQAAEVWGLVVARN